MRLFIFPKTSRLKLVNYFQISKRFITDNTEVKINAGVIHNNAGKDCLIEVCDTWAEDDDPVLRERVLRDMRVIADFVTENEETRLMSELEPYLKTMRYEFDHWDNAIHGYRETERDQWREENRPVLERVRREALKAEGFRGRLLSHLHVLDLSAEGHIKPHVDAVRHCGDVIAGACLLSPALMRLEHTDRPERALLALLPRRCLYVMSGVARYRFTHAVVSDGLWRGRSVKRDRRVSLICRSHPRDGGGGEHQ